MRMQTKHCLLESVGRAAMILFLSTTVIVPSGAAASATLAIDFELGVGNDGQAVASTYPGVRFGSSGNSRLVYADFTTGAYNVTTGAINMFGPGQYFAAGLAAAYAEGSDPVAIFFTVGTASFVRIGYSSASTLYLDAFDPNGNVVASEVGMANTRSIGGSALAYLEVFHPEIASIQIHDSGSFWLIDNLESDAPVPEPSPIIGLMFALAVLGFRIRWLDVNHSSSPS